VTAPQPKQRIVSLAPSATSILVEIGAKPQLVGVSKWCADVAPEVAALPRVGDCWSLDPETVLRLNPKVVIGSVPYKPETVAKLLECPFAFVAMNPRSLADVEYDIQLLGRIAGRTPAASVLTAKMRKNFDDVRRNAKTFSRKKRPRVYCESWPHPRIASPGWVSELVELGGGEMVVTPGKRVSDEEVAAAQPEIIVLAWAAVGGKSDPRKAYEVPAWREVPAIRNQKVYVVRDELLNTPGPPLMEGARELFRLIHGAPSGKRVRQSAGRAK
jgi:iron complex transport system substrate-binding protein